MYRLGTAAYLLFHLRPAGLPSESQDSESNEGEGEGSRNDGGGCSVKMQMAAESHSRTELVAEASLLSHH